ncbi:MAG: hypothetical protein IPJ87_14825 [Flavobacteriales bacterium]|nr:hypothetical protein [Flavobacteriales bacterium]MBK7943123.1 hypothetical protein [Flavobacteriales bacterium]MBK9701824.1 hypothetical protein [Flavobacteriales bacterium]
MKSKAHELPVQYENVGTPKKFTNVTPFPVIAVKLAMDALVTFRSWVSEQVAPVVSVTKTVMVIAPALLGLN